MISFCTSYLNRFHQFSEVVRENVASIRGKDVEWNILNFGSQDELHPFMLEQLPRLPHNLTYAYDHMQRNWHACIAKNLAHVLGRGDVLMNLDCDNLIGDAIDVLKSIPQIEVVHMFSSYHQDGTYGRIAISKELFYKLGGYDESFFPMGYQDADLLARAEDVGAELEEVPCESSLAIKNTKEESIKYCRIGNMKWEEYSLANRRSSNYNRSCHRFTANSKTNWAFSEQIDIYHGGSSHLVESVTGNDLKQRAMKCLNT